MDSLSLFYLSQALFMDNLSWFVLSPGLSRALLSSTSLKHVSPLEKKWDFNNSKASIYLQSEWIYITIINLSHLDSREEEKRNKKKYEHTEVYTLVTKGYNRLSLLNKTKLFIKTKQKNISDIICQITVGHRTRRTFLKTTYTINILNGV